MRLMMIRSFVLGLAACGMAMPLAGGAAEPPAVNWTAKTAAGAEVKVPAADKPTVLLFIRAEQPQSHQAIKQAAAILEGKAAQVLVVLSGQEAAAQAKALADSGKSPWPLVADVDYAASGKMSVHVWPTTVIISAAGLEAGHLAGLPKAYASNLDAYVEFAAGRIDKAALEKKLTTHDTVSDSSDQSASRHLQVAQRLLERGKIDAAKAEVDAVRKLNPQQPVLKLELAKTLLLIGQAEDALTILDALPAGSAPTWQVNVMRGRALILQGKWDQAKTVLPEAMRLSPDKSEAHYLLGLVYEHEKDAAKATEHYKAAFETAAPHLKLDTAGR